MYYYVVVISQHDTARFESTGVSPYCEYIIQIRTSIGKMQIDNFIISYITYPFFLFLLLTYPPKKIYMNVLAINDKIIIKNLFAYLFHSMSNIY